MVVRSVFTVISTGHNFSIWPRKIVAKFPVQKGKTNISSFGWEKKEGEPKIQKNNLLPVATSYIMEIGAYLI